MIDKSNKYRDIEQFLFMIYDEKNGIKTSDFYGDVLFIGMGSLYFPKKISADSITIVEKYEDVIEMQKNNFLPEWTIIKDDGYVFTTNKKFDVIMLDMWYEMITEKELNSHINRYTEFLKENGKIIYLKTIKIK